MKKLLLATALLADIGNAAAEPFVWLDTERGPIVLELDSVRAPGTTSHFRQIVDEGFFDGLVFHRTIPNFIIQSGRLDERGATRTRTPNPTVASETDNGLLNTPGTIAFALPGTSSGTNRNGGTTEFFINTGTSPHLDADFTVFGRVVYGMPTVDAIGNQVTYSNSVPYRPVLIRRAVNSDSFPIMPLHTGSWFDPANSGRGISLEMSTIAGGDGSPLMVAYWYDYADGKQIWMTGAAPFEYGASEVVLPMQISDGGQFGAAFDPEAVTFDEAFGTLTIRFSGCNAGEFSYDTKLGSGTLPMVRITIPDGEACTAN